MNKKFSTLVAALLASGGLFYAVDAMILPAGDGVAQTFVGVRTADNEATAEVVACNSSIAKGKFVAAWRVKTVSGPHYYLEVADASASDWILCEGKIQKITGDNVAFAAQKAIEITIAADNRLMSGSDFLVIDTKTGAVSLGDTKAGNAYLFSDKTTQVAPEAIGSTSGSLALATNVTTQTVGTNDVKWEETPEKEGTVKLSSSVSSAETEWSIEKSSGNFYLRQGSSYLKNVDGGLILVSACPTDDASVVSVAGVNHGLQIGGKYLSANLTLGDGEDAATGFYLVKNPNTSMPSAESGIAAGNYNVVSVQSTELGNTVTNWEELVINQAIKPASATLAQNTYSSTAVEVGEKWTVTADNNELTVKSANYFLNAPTSDNDVVLGKETEATPLTFDGADGALKSGALFLMNNSGIKTNDGGTGKKLYLFTEAGVLVTDATKIDPATSYLIAEKKATTTATEMVNVTVVKQTPGAPGADIPGMAENGLSVDGESGEITVSSEETKNIPAPATVAIGENVLSVVSGKVVYLPAKEAAKADSWVLVDGKYKNVDLEKAGETKIWLKAAEGLFKSTAAPFTLVENTTAASTFIAKPEGKLAITDGGNTKEFNDVVLTATGEATAATIADANKGIHLTSVATGNTVLLGNGTQFVGTDGTGSKDNATLWVVSKTATTTVGTYRYSFKQKDTETYFEVGDVNEFTAEDYNGGFALKAPNGQYVSISNKGVASLVSESTSSALFGIPASAKPFTAKEILSDHGTLTSFNLSLWDKKDGTSTLVQNPFENADLVPVYYDAAKKTFTPITADNASTLTNPSTFLLKKGSSYIVVETTKDSEWSNINTELVKGGYKFVTLSEKAMADVMTTGEWKDGSYAPYFTFNFDQNSVDAGVATAKTPIYTIEVSDKDKANASKISTFTIKTGAQAGTYLTTSSEAAYWVYAEFSANNAVRGDSDKDYNPLNMKYVNITFVNHASITWNNIKLNDKVLGAEVKPADADNFLFSKPEGQWAVQMSAATAAVAKGEALDNVYGFTFVNRESGKKYSVDKMYYLGNNKYAVASSSKFAENAGTLRDTLAITPVEGLKNNTIQRDGYKNLTAEEVQDQLFNLLLASSEEDYYVGENHTAKSHFLGLSHDADAAVNWRIVPLTAARAYNADKELTQASDSVYVFNHPQYYKASDKKFYQYNDTLAIIGYALQNTANDEFLTYENPQTTDRLSMICDPNFKSYTTTKNISEAYRFVLKEKGTDLYNIIGVDYPTYKNGLVEDETTHATLDLSSKLYGATTLTKQGAVEVVGAYAQINSNDLFKVQKLGAPEYRLQSMGDTIRIFRQENDYDQMYENGEFLNLGNKAQLTTMAPALYVDTAYVKRGNNNRYQYLLVVNPEYKAAVYDNANHLLKPDTMYGRFLVNLVDTANVAYQNGAIHANKYINDTEAGETYAKLGFVYGFRTADKLYITDKNYKKSAKASDVIDLGTSDFNTAKFAFRYIDPINHEADGSFKIQTGYYDYNAYIAKNKQPEVANNGYLKNINGVVVVADGYEAGDKFDLAAEHSNPTANEGINTSEVSVIAKEGEVVINGAAGKTVVITNVLGQTIASTVLSSDNATIAAPAGVVVVAVEGEAAVKAIVK
ncbi:DUF6383 domain-containing protein [Parabacteroides gordonii]|uniref:DUF6383 domain-containing protein n=1 Tax=Parabacteroides gordonii TaxID=574930 RepID=UPI0004011FA9|nr:DUF6383 domain-containing protein [Parabacteroides gordonii]